MSCVDPASDTPNDEENSPPIAQTFRSKDNLVDQPEKFFTFEVVGPGEQPIRAIKQIRNRDQVAELVNAALREAGADASFYGRVCQLQIHTGKATSPLKVATRDHIITAIRDYSNLVQEGGEDSMLVEAFMLLSYREPEAKTPEQKRDPPGKDKDGCGTKGEEPSFKKKLTEAFGLYRGPDA